MRTTKATHAEIEGVQGPNFGGGYRVDIFNGEIRIATSHFSVPVEYRYWHSLKQGIGEAYKNAKKFCASFGVE